ncbi:MAG TPA: hypothetical protein VJ276_09525 [Thermoanaerobaculia bacterium]|nr:hypothetical protein [Thermoanaerobaculia bacterium]
MSKGLSKRTDLPPHLREQRRRPEPRQEVPIDVPEQEQPPPPPPPEPPNRAVDPYLRRS